MICPNCKNENIKVLESRDTDWGLAIRRRRECNECNHRFTTFEKIEMANFFVLKKHWAKEVYNRKKLETWVLLALSKRSVTNQQVEDFFIKLEQKWNWLWKEISSSQIWDDVIQALKDLDEVAYIRFVSVYKSLSAEQIKEELADFLDINK